MGINKKPPPEEAVSLIYRQISFALFAITRFQCPDGADTHRKYR